MKFYFLTEIRISFYFVQKGENERKKDNKREKERYIKKTVNKKNC